MGLLNHTREPAQRTVLLQQALSEAEKLGPGLEMARTLEMQAADSMGARNDARAESYLKRALPVNEQTFGKDSREVAHNLDVLAIVLSNEKKEAEAEGFFQHEVAIFEKAAGQPVLLSIAEQHLADLYNQQKKYAEAEPVYVRSLQAAEASPSPNDSAVIDALRRLAFLYNNWGKPEQAVPYYIRLAKLKDSPSNFDASLIPDLETLADLLRKLNRAAEAQNYDERRKQLIDLEIAKRAASLPTK